MPLLVLLFLSSLLLAETGFLDRQLTVGDQTMRYQVFVPRDYSRAQAWPVILCLHGVGERGSDGSRQTVIALADAIRRFPERYPAIVVLPQAPMGGAWLEQALALAEASLAETEREFRTDPTRVYLTGYSMGGLGVYHLAMRQPHRFAAIAILCAGFGLPEGAIPPDLVPLLTRKAELFPPLSVLTENWKSRAPLRVYAGGRDKLVPPATVQLSVEAIRQAGAAVDFRELPEANHNLWDPVYRDPEFAQWLLAQRLLTKH